ncbi:Alpha/Beta hydrolase protein [Dipodascopsis uninucleata]
MVPINSIVSDLPLYKSKGIKKLSLFDNVTLKGVVSEGDTEEFLGIPYATIAERWTAPTRYRSEEEYVRDYGTQGSTAVEIDCTKYGPRSSQNDSDDPSHNFMSSWFTRLSNRRVQAESQLHLNVICPSASLLPRDLKSLLPVFVYIHGGGFNNGDSSCETDATLLVRRSVELRRPIIVVKLSFRLNTFGHFWTQALENELDKNFGCSNFGLLDQRAGLVWVQQFISVFGGDKDRVTIAGQSSGGMSVMMLAQQPKGNFRALGYEGLDGEDKIFSRVLAMSPADIILATEEDLENRTEILLTNTGYYSLNDRDHSPEDKLRYLRSLPAEFLAEAKASGLGAIAADGVFTAKDQTRAVVPIADWVDALMIGATRDEFASLSYRQLKDVPDASIFNMLTISMSKFANSDDELSRILYEIYELAAPADETFIGDPNFRKCLFKILGDIYFDFYNSENLELSARKNRNCYLYELKLADNFVHSVTNGYSGHSFCIPFFFYLAPVSRKFDIPLNIIPENVTKEQYYEIFKSSNEEELKATADEVSSRLITFIYGEEPWPAFNSSAKPSLIFDGIKTTVIDKNSRHGPGGRWYGWEKLSESNKALLRNTVKSLV